MFSIRSFLTPIGAIIAIGALFLPWFKGHLTFIGKVVNGAAFPGVFWVILLGCLLLMAIFIFGLTGVKRNLARYFSVGLSLSTLLLALIILYGYGQKSTAPGVSVQMKHGVPMAFGGLILALIGAWPWWPKRLRKNIKK